MYTKFVFCDLGVYFFIEFAIISENCVHFFEFLHDKVILIDDGLHCDTTSNEHLIDSHKFCQLWIVDQFLELRDFVLKRDH